MQRHFTAALARTRGKKITFQGLFNAGKWIDCRIETDDFHLGNNCGFYLSTMNSSFVPQKVMNNVLINTMTII